MKIQQGFNGEGRVLLSRRDVIKFIPVGVVSKLDPKTELDTFTLKSTATGGGVAQQYSRIKGMNIDMEWMSLNSQNLGILLRGAPTASPVAPITNDLKTAFSGAFLPVQGISPTSVTVTVTPPTTWADLTAYALGTIISPTAGTHFYRCTVAGTSGATEPTWKTDGTTNTDGTATWIDAGLKVIPSTDYVVSQAGITISETCPQMVAEGTPVTLAYTPSASYTIEAFVDPEAEYILILEGTNAANENKPFSMRFHRVQIPPLAGLALLGNDKDFTGVTTQLTVLRDDTITGDDESKFMQMIGIED